MIEEKITGHLGLYDKLEDHYGKRYAFRGVKKVSYPLIPKVGRGQFEANGDIQAIEKSMLGEFRRVACQYVDEKLIGPLEWLALAQHHGMSTRLMDWTWNPLAAAYFSTVGDELEDSAIYVIDLERLQRCYGNVKPFLIKKMGWYAPRHFNRRITAQNSIFTINPDPEKEDLTGVIKKYVILKKIKKRLHQHLYAMGVNAHTMFPDLNGLSALIEWEHSKSIS
jgi:hypothetical protein